MIRDMIDENDAIKVNSREVELLKEHFGGCFNNEGKFDLEKFRTLIGDEVNIIEENQGFNFLGKSYARMIAGQESLTVIRPDEEHNSRPENRDSENIYISGDNLDALKHLCKSYAGQVKCIYIDPPYNTGSDGFVYNDKFNFNAEELSHKLGINHEQAEHILDMKKSSSASDSAWLTFMLPRLELAKDMLSKDGVIFISIDDNEQANLKLLCDEIFGVENFVAPLTIIVKPEGRRYGDFAKTHEYALVYAKYIDYAIFNEIEVEGSTYQYQDDIGGFNLKGLRNRNVVAFNSSNRPNLRYPFYVDISNPDENGLCKVSTEMQDGYEEVMPSIIDGLKSVWRWGKEKATNEIEKLVAYRGNDGEIRIFQKERKLTQTPKTVWFDKNIISNKGTSEVESLLGKGVFNFPKPLRLIENILSIGSGPNDIIMDFFSGSATTAHAVMELNSIDSGHRKYILVQLPEPCNTGSLAEKQGYKTIDEIGQERIRRAAKKIKEDNPLFAGDLGFKHFTLESFEDDTIDRLYDFDMNAELNDNGILSKFGAKTVLTTWLCRDGYGLNPKVSEVKLKDYTAYFCGKHLYLLDADFYQEEMGELIDKMSDTTQHFNPDVIVVFGYGMGYSTRLMLDKNLVALAEARGNKISLDIRY